MHASVILSRRSLSLCPDNTPQYYSLIQTNLFTGYFPSSMCNLPAISKSSSYFNIAGNMFWCPFPSQCAYVLETHAVRACVRARVRLYTHACTYPSLHAWTSTTRRSFVRPEQVASVIIIHTLGLAVAVVVAVAAFGSTR